MSYIQDGPNLRPFTAIEGAVLPTIPVGTYTIRADLLGFYLEPTEGFNLPAKRYGENDAHASRILSTFQRRSNNLGVLLGGEKGSGKTLLAKTVSVAARAVGWPTLLVNSPYRGDAFNSFLQGITQPCVTLFDEYEKVYDEEQQQELLTLFDGVIEGRKLFILTCNELYRVAYQLKNRPGRIRYLLEYRGVDHKFIYEYCEDHGVSERDAKEIVRLAICGGSMNFDMLSSLVEEMALYQEPPSASLRYLNVRASEGGRRFTVHVVHKGIEIPPESLQESCVRIDPVDTEFIVCFCDNGGQSRKFLFRGEDLVDIRLDGSLVYAQPNEETLVTLFPWQRREGLLSTIGQVLAKQGV